MSILPPRNNNVDLTRSTMQRRINTLVRVLTGCFAALHRKNKKINGYNHFINFLISQEKLTRAEVKDFFKNKISRNIEVVAGTTCPKCGIDGVFKNIDGYRCEECSTHFDDNMKELKTINNEKTTME